MQSIYAQLREQGTDFVTTRRIGGTIYVKTLARSMRDLEADGFTKLLKRDDFDTEVETWLGEFTSQVSAHEDHEVFDKLSIASILAAWYYARCQEIDKAYCDGKMTTRSYQSARSRAKARVISRY